MTTLCQIIEIDDEVNFLQNLKAYGEPLQLGERRDVFNSSIPEIHTTIEIFRDDSSELFRVLYHHLMLKQETLMPSGSLVVEGCFVFVVKIR